MRLPTERGPLSNGVLRHLRDETPLAAPGSGPSVEPDSARDPLTDDDLQLALALCYELHYRGFADIDDRWEWDPELLRFRAGLEARFEDALRAAVRPVGSADATVDRVLAEMIAATSGSGLSGHLMKRGTVEQYRDFLVQRSVYHLREADSHTWTIPRLAGRPKAALVEIQADEYGNGDPDRMHAVLFSRSMRALGLDDTYGAHWDEAYAETFATVNFMSMVGLHRRLRGAAAGHLAALEMDSTAPNRRYAAGLRRLGFGREATEFFDEHVEADAVHEQVAAVDLCGSLARTEPSLRTDILWGAACCLHLDEAAGARMLAQWRADQPAGAA